MTAFLVYATIHLVCAIQITRRSFKYRESIEKWIERRKLVSFNGVPPQWQPYIWSAVFYARLAQGILFAPYYSIRRALWL